MPIQHPLSGQSGYISKEKHGFSQAVLVATRGD